MHKEGIISPTYCSCQKHKLRVYPFQKLRHLRYSFQFHLVRHPIHHHPMHTDSPPLLKLQTLCSFQNPNRKAQSNSQSHRSPTLQRQQTTNRPNSRMHYKDHKQWPHSFRKQQGHKNTEYQI